MASRCWNRCCGATSTRYPDFDINRLVEYLQRGAWPFLSLLIVAVVMVPIGVIVVGLYVLVILLLADAGQKWLVAVLAVLSIPLVVLLVAALLFFCGSDHVAQRR